MTRSQKLLKPLAIAAFGGFLPVLSHAQHNFTYDFTGPQGLFILRPASADWTETNIPMGTSPSAWSMHPSDHGVLDSAGDETHPVSLILGNGSTTGGYDWTLSHDAGYDLSATGSSLRYEMWYMPSFAIDQGTIATPLNELIQIGLITGSTAAGTLSGNGNGTGDSLYISGLETSSNSYLSGWTAPDPNTGYRTRDRHGHGIDFSVNDENGVLSALGSEELHVKMDVEHVPSGSATVQGTNYYRFIVDMTNTGSGLMDIDVNIDEWAMDYSTPNSILNNSNFANYSLTGVTHGLSSLTDLRPSIGSYVHDGTTLGVSGINWDSSLTPITPDISVIPEPSALLLGGLAGCLALLRRRR